MSSFFEIAIGSHETQKLKYLCPLDLARTVCVVLSWESPLENQPPPGI